MKINKQYMITNINEYLLEYYKLNEFLSNSLEFDVAIDRITTDVFIINNNELEQDDFDVNIINNNIVLEFKNKYNSDDILKILTSIYTCGYFISQYFISMDKIKDKLILSETEFLKYWNKPPYKKFDKYNKNITYFKLKCEKKHDTSIKPNDKIYHITYNTKDILKNGLLPKCNKRKSYHPERVYFLNDINDVTELLSSLKRNDTLTNNNKIYDLLEINTIDKKTDSFIGKVDVKFYQDPNSKGIYTYDKIEKDRIKLIKTNI